MKITKRELTAKISERTGLTLYQSKKALKTILSLMKRALRDGKQIDLGKAGKLKVVARKPTRRINMNLRHVGPNIEDVHKKHPKSVRLLGGKDLSENPQPTIIHKNPESVEVPARRKVRVAVAITSWRGKIRKNRR